MVLLPGGVANMAADFPRKGPGYSIQQVTTTSGLCTIKQTPGLMLIKDPLLITILKHMVIIKIKTGVT